jgi:two-component system, chemotaxis family, protein-glutamate methylesterase/glutaminase
MQNEPGYFIVIGASAGSLGAVIELIGQADKNMNAAFFLVIHFSTLAATQSFTSRLQKQTGVPCSIAQNGMPVEKGIVYIAPPGAHLLIKKGSMILGNGPVENRWRPSIDSLFRSAAAAYNSQVIGIILGGMLSDGTSGMIAIKNSGGICMVQDPAEADFPDMILSVLQHTQVDYCIPVAEMGQVLQEKTNHALPKPAIVPYRVKTEAAIAENAIVDMNLLPKIGDHSVFTCPDCGGGLWQIKEGGFTRYRCHTGHVYNTDEYQERLQQGIESTLWVALRMLEEKKQMLEKMAGDEEVQGLMHASEQKRTRIAELKIHIEKLKEFLFASREVLKQ